MAGEFGSYVVERTLGAGSFATVWLANDPVLETHVAIKVLADNWSHNADVRRRFIDEARILRQISHDGVIRVFLIDELADGRPYFVMEWADRGALHDRVTTAPWTPTDATDTVIELLDCLTVVHDVGVVHRDIKPSNVLYRSLRSHERAADLRSGGRRTERMVLGDFGLAKNLITSSGFTLAAGTPAYMAPEQSKTSATIGPTADIYSAGAILHELLNGQPPLRDDADLPERRDLPVGVADVVARALAPDPADRFPSALAMATALRSLPTTDAGRAVGHEVVPDLPDSLPLRLRDDAVRLLGPGTVADRLGLAADADRASLHGRAEAALAEWNTQLNTGRIPFSARPTADRVIELLEHVWLDTRD